MTNAPLIIMGWKSGTFDLLPEYYSCYMVYVPKPCSKRMAKIIDFLPHNCPVPALSSTDVARNALEDLSKAVQKPPPDKIDVLNGGKILKFHQYIQEIFFTVMRLFNLRLNKKDIFAKNSRNGGVTTMKLFSGILCD